MALTYLYAVAGRRLYFFYQDLETLPLYHTHICRRFVEETGTYIESELTGSLLVPSFFLSLFCSLVFEELLLALAGRVAALVRKARCQVRQVEGISVIRLHGRISECPYKRQVSIAM